MKFRKRVHEADKIRKFRVPKVKRLLLQMKRPFLIRSERETQFNFGGVFPRNRALRTSDTFHNLNPTRRIPSSCSLPPPPTHLTYAPFAFFWGLIHSLYSNPVVGTGNSVAIDHYCEGLLRVFLVDQHCK